MKTIIRKEVRVMGIDDAPFKTGSKKDTIVIGTVFRGGQFMDGVVSTKVRIDGKNATKKIAEMINKSKFKPQLQALILDGIAVGGFNVIDIKKLYKLTNKAIIVVMRDYPDLKKMFLTLKHLKMENKINIIKKAGTIYKEGKIHFQAIGITTETARLVLRTITTRAHVPEPIRIAHLIGAGIVDGESRGRA